MLKFELTSNTKVIDGRTLYQIKASNLDEEKLPAEIFEVIQHEIIELKNQIPN